MAVNTLQLFTYYYLLGRQVDADMQSTPKTKIRADVTVQKVVILPPGDRGRQHLAGNADIVPGKSTGMSDARVVVSASTLSVLQSQISVRAWSVRIYMSSIKNPWYHSTTRNNWGEWPSSPIEVEREINRRERGHDPLGHHKRWIEKRGANDVGGVRDPHQGDLMCRSPLMQSNRIITKIAARRFRGTLVPPYIALAEVRSHVASPWVVITSVP